jgi:hypothetical protein
LDQGPIDQGPIYALITPVYFLLNVPNASENLRKPDKKNELTRNIQTDSYENGYREEVGHELEHHIDARRIIELGGVRQERATNFPCRRKMRGGDDM